MFKVNNKDTRTTPLVLFKLCYFKLCPSFLIVNFEHVIAGWASSSERLVVDKS